MFSVTLVSNTRFADALMPLAVGLAVRFKTELVNNFKLFTGNAVPLVEFTASVALLTIISPATLGVTVEDTRLKVPPFTTVGPV